MASFKGTFAEFYQWAGPRTRYWITQETRDKRHSLRSQGGCSGCHRQDVPLTAAHIVARKEVVREALGVAEDGHEIDIDLADAWSRIKEAHRPFEEKFNYLCEECHRGASGA